MDSTRDFSRCVLQQPTTTRKNSADTREGSPDSIIHSPSFTFLVGPKHTRLTIQSGLAQHVSKPLHNLMNNGHTRESKHRIAVLEDEDVETFVAFCEYAYTGDYSVPRVPTPTPTPQPEHKPRIIESTHSPTHSWRQSCRSDSVSSVVPPPAPSPPPETPEVASPTVAAPAEPEPEPTPVIEEDVSAEAAAEEKDKTKEHAEPEGAEVFHESQEPEPEPAVSSQPVAGEETNPTPENDNDNNNNDNDNDNDDWASWGVTSDSKPKKSKKESKKKKKRGGYQTTAEEPPASLTPPSTPPPAHPEANEITPPEQAAEEPAAEDNAPESEPIEEAPAEAEPEPEPAAEPEEWEETPTGPPENPDPVEEEDPQVEGSWDEGTAENQDDANEAAEAPPKPFIDMSFAKQPDSSPHTPGLSLWDEFTSLQYVDERPASSMAPPVEVCTDDLPYLTFHAKVYVFATRYLIPVLAQLCLRKLHRDLLHLSFAESANNEPSPGAQNPDGLAMQQASMVLDLLRYAYTKTTRLEPISPTSATQLRENELRRLVVHYAACKVKELARYHSSDDSGMATPAVRLMDSKVERAEDAAPKSLRVLLDLTPELASDLVYRMM